MLIQPETLRLVLATGLFAMLVLAAFYLRTRELSFLKYLGWGMFAVMLPLLGPFLVILSRPGKQRH